ncbi:MAG: hypothetical protein AB1730_25170 [Myxococcota bacterium]
MSGGAPKPKAPKKPAPPARLADAKAGDWVEYEVSVERGSGAEPFRLRLSAVEVGTQRAVIDARATGGVTAPIWLRRGVRLTLSLEGEAPTPETPFSWSGRERETLESRTVAGRAFPCRAWGVSTEDGPAGGGCGESPARELALGNGLVEERVRNFPPAERSNSRVTRVAFGHDEPGAFDAGELAPQRWSDGTRLSVRRDDELVQETLKSVGGQWVATQKRLRRQPGAPMRGLVDVDPKEWKAPPSFDTVRTALEQLVVLAERGRDVWPCGWCARP